MTNKVKVGSNFRKFRNELEYNIVKGNVELIPTEVTSGFCYISGRYQEGQFYSATIEENLSGVVSTQKFQISREGFCRLPIMRRNFEPPEFHQNRAEFNVLP